MAVSLNRPLVTSKAQCLKGKRNMSTPTQLALFDNPSDDRPLPEIIASEFGFALTYHDTDEGRLYALFDWITGVAQTDSPSDLWGKMKKRLTKDGVEHSTWCRKLQYTSQSNGRTYKTEFAPDVVLYQVAQRMDASTGVRNKVLAYLAKAGVVLDEFRRNPELMLSAAEQHYLNEQKARHGLTDQQAMQARSNTAATVKRITSA